MVDLAFLMEESSGRPELRKLAMAEEKRQPRPMMGVVRGTEGASKSRSWLDLWRKRQSEFELLRDLPEMRVLQ